MFVSQFMKYPNSVIPLTICIGVYIKRVYEILANVAYLLRLALKFLTRKLRIVNICLYQKPKHNPKIITWHSLFKVTYLKYLVRRVILLIYRVE